MSSEFKFGSAINFILVSTLAAECTITYINRLETERALIASTALNPNCLEVAPRLQHYDMVAVFDAGTYDKNGITQPNSYQEERLKAAAAAIAAGYSNKILLIDGGDGSVEYASKELLEKYVNEISLGQKTLDRNKIKSIRYSINSAKNVDDLGQYMKENGITTVLGITDLFHYLRINVLTENYGVRADIVPTECLAIRYLPGDLPYLARRNYSPEMVNRELTEKMALIELSIDWKGKGTIALKALLNRLGFAREK